MTTDTVGAERLVGVEIGGKYKIVRLLGEGGMGCVYQGEQKLGHTIRKVAIKTLHEHLSRDPQILARFEREVGTVAGLQHPNTIQVFDFGSMDDGTLYIVMEFVEGKSVASTLETGGPMPPQRVSHILQQVCGSLEEAHGLGIVHRDLKPDNVVLCDKAGQHDWVEVLDFGIAKRSTEVDEKEQKLTQQGMVLGTPPYMSPEQFTGRPVDRRSDIYSLGVMAYEMLTGGLPFSGNTAWEWATAHMTAQPRSIDTFPQSPHIPPAMKAAISRALEKDPNRRFANVTEFYQAFSAAGTDVTSAASAWAPPTHVATQPGAPLPMPSHVPTPAPGYQTGAQPQPYPYGTPAAGNHTYTPQPFSQVPQMPAAPAPPQQKKGGAAGIVIALLGVLILVGGVAVFFLFGRSKPVGAQNDQGNDPKTHAASTAPADTSLAAINSAAPTDSSSLDPLALGSAKNTSAFTGGPTTHASAHPTTTATAPATTTAPTSTTAPTYATTEPTYTAPPVYTATQPTYTATAPTTPPGYEPPACVGYHFMLAHGGRGRGLAAQKQRCIQQGGTP